MFLLTAFLSLVNLASAAIIFIVEKTIRQTNHAQYTTDKVMVNSVFAWTNILPWVKCLWKNELQKTSKKSLQIWNFSLTAKHFSQIFTSS